MKHRFVLLAVLLVSGTIWAAETKIPFDTYFSDHTMRIDYYHIGDADSEWITLDQIYKQGQWAGSTRNLVDEFNNGRYYVKVYDATGNKLIYSRGFDSYFGEYQTSGPAGEGIKRTYHESALIPYPKNPVRFTIESRNREKQLQTIFSQIINPDSSSIIRQEPGGDVQVYEVLKNGDPHRKVDVAFIAEGYTAGEKEKAKQDFRVFSDILFSIEPYKSRQDQFNIYGVFKASVESGVDEPTHGSYRNTVVDATFNSMGSERYLLTENNRALRDLAAHAPYDALVIMVNHDRYGGGGIYNFFCTFTTDNQWREYLLLHEFGHSFTGLADEYYTSSTAYNEFYPTGIEPTEPNITALQNPPGVKWDSLLSSGIEIPTPWAKTSFDTMDERYQNVRQKLNEEIARLERENAPQEQISMLKEESEDLSRKHARIMDKFLEASPYFGKVGAFEGAGYSSKGLYRPMLDCLMFSKGSKPFCDVCRAAVEKMIQYYTE
ncbi:MAG: M64 family metallopeptidase [Calditrichia bacterium]